MSVIESAAALLVRFSDQGWSELLKQHVADTSGHCRACHESSGAAPVWPCGLWSIAEAARRLHAEGG